MAAGEEEEEEESRRGRRREGEIESAGADCMGKGATERRSDGGLEQPYSSCHAGLGFTSNRRGLAGLRQRDRRDSLGGLFLSCWLRTTGWLRGERRGIRRWSDWDTMDAQEKSWGGYVTEMGRAGVEAR